MSLNEKVQNRGNVVDNRLKVTTGEYNKNDYDQVFRMLTSKIIKINITEAKRKYGVKAKGGVTLENLLSLCIDNNLHFETEPVVRLFSITHQEEGMPAIQFNDRDVEISDSKKIEEDLDSHSEEVSEESKNEGVDKIASDLNKGTKSKPVKNPEPVENEPLF